MKIYPERSRAAIETLARRIGKPARETASGVIAIANANMEKAVRVISIERGYDPRDFALFSFGGAGGMHAVEMAAHLRMSAVVVPRNAGVLSAFGLLLADCIKDYTKSLMKTDSRVSPADLEREFRTLEDQSLRDMREDGFAACDVRLERTLDCRYLGQSYEIAVPYRRGRRGTGPAFLESFHRSHARLYSYRHDGRPVEIVNLRVKAVAAAPKIPLMREPPRRKASLDPAAAVKRQLIIFAGREARGTVYDRAKLVPGNVVRGPGLVIDPESTTFLPPGYAGRLDGYFNLIIRKQGPA